MGERIDEVVPDDEVTREAGGGGGGILTGGGSSAGRHANWLLRINGPAFRIAEAMLRCYDCPAHRCTAPAASALLTNRLRHPHRGAETEQWASVLIELFPTTKLPAKRVAEEEGFEDSKAVMEKTKQFAVFAHS